MIYFYSYKGLLFVVIGASQQFSSYSHLLYCPNQLFWSGEKQRQPWMINLCALAYYPKTEEATWMKSFKIRSPVDMTHD